MDDQSLYRALRQAEIDAGNILIPKGQKPFVAPLRLPFRLPAQLGDTVEHAIRDHQDHGKFPTRGISTTPFLERAVHYAQRHRVIARIDRSTLVKLGVRSFRVRDRVDPQFISVPEDDEIILLYEEGDCLPRECIAEVIRI
jgi:hypothetical protein